MIEILSLIVPPWLHGFHEKVPELLLPYNTKASSFPVGFLKSPCGLTPRRIKWGTVPAEKEAAVM